MEKSRGHAVALHQAHGAGIAVRQDGLCCVATARHDSLQPRRNIAQRGVPTHGYKLSAALWAAALEWPQHPFGVVAALGIAGHLGTQSTGGLGMRRVALHLDGHAERHSGQQGTGVRAIVRAGAEYLVAAGLCLCSAVVAAVNQGVGVCHGLIQLCRPQGLAGFLASNAVYWPAFGSPGNFALDS